MTLKQLRYFLAIIDGSMNITNASGVLYISQAAISKQIKLLEDELNIELFLRRGKRILALTEAGHKMEPMARKLLLDSANITQMSRDLNKDDSGHLTIAATHTQTCYVLPDVVRKFLTRYPRIQLEVNQGTPLECAEWVATGKADVCISTEVVEECSGVELLYRYNEFYRCVVAPTGHQLTERTSLTLTEIARYPIITYSASSDSHSKILHAFNVINIKPSIMLTAQNSGVIKTYVRKGFGIGIISEIAATEDMSDLVALDARHLFDPSTSVIGIRPGHFIGRHLAYFIETCIATTAHHSGAQPLASPVH